MFSNAKLDTFMTENFPFELWLSFAFTYTYFDEELSSKDSKMAGEKKK